MRTAVTGWASGSELGTPFFPNGVLSVELYAHSWLEAVFREGARASVGVSKP